MKTTAPSRSMGSHHRPNRGKTCVWLTPPAIIDALGPFDLDPCAPEVQPWPTAAYHYHDRGLERDWYGTVFLNPPYGHPDQWPWVEKLADHGDGIALLFARTETAGFHDHCWSRSSGMLFLRGRLHFHYPDGRRAKANAGAPSVLVAYGEDGKGRLERCGLAGHFVGGAA